MSATIVTAGVTSLSPQHFFANGIHSVFGFLTQMEWLHAMRTCHAWKTHAVTSPIRGISICLSLFPGRMRFTGDIPKVLYPSPLCRHIRRIDCGAENWFFLRYTDITLMAKELVNLEWLECRLRHKPEMVLSVRGQKMVTENATMAENTAAAAAIQPLVLPPRLRHLTAYFTHDCKIEESNRLLVALPSCTQLDTLVLGKMLGGVDITPLVSCTALTSLKLDLWHQIHGQEESSKSSTESSKLDLRALVHLTKIPYLTSLSINDGLKNDVILSDLSTIPNYSFPCLTSLNLIKCALRPETLGFLVEIVPHLQVLNAQTYDPTDFSCIRQFKHLHTIHFMSHPLGLKQRLEHDYDFNAVNHAELEYAQALASCSSLTALHFMDPYGWCFESMDAWNCLLTGASQLTSLSFDFAGLHKNLLYLLSGHQPSVTIGEMLISEMNAYRHLKHPGGEIIEPEPQPAQAPGGKVIVNHAVPPPISSVSVPVSTLSSGSNILGAQCNRIRHLYLAHGVLFPRSLEELRYFTALESLILENAISYEFSFEQTRAYCQEMEERFFTKPTPTSSSSSATTSCSSSSSKSSQWRQLRILATTNIWDETGYARQSIYFEFDRASGIDTISKTASLIP